MASNDEDDYLSDKFLLQNAGPTTSSKPLTYAERRKQAQKEAQLKNVQNRKKSRRQLEEEAREEGLSKSLFEKAKAEEQELGTKNKAMSMMLKMGFKPGASLGRPDDGDHTTLAGPSTEIVAETPVPKKSDSQHRKEPLPLDLWTGKKGVGSGKRPLSPGTADRLSKVAKLTEETDKETYRSRTREEYEERRAEGRLLSATRTLQTLDERANIQFNVLSLNPHDPDSIPPELLERLSETAAGLSTGVTGDKATDSERLRRQMHLDALQPLEADADDDVSALASQQEQALKNAPLSDETVEEAMRILRLTARERLGRVLAYLRQRHFYCFWCGTQFNDKQDMDDNCPGEDEDAHD